MERPAVTVVVPGRGVRPREVLAVDGKVRRGPVRRGPARWVGLAVAAVLSLGVVRLATYDPPPVLPPVPPPPQAPAVVPAPPVLGVTATALDPGLRGGPLVERFGLYVRITPPRPPGASADPSADDGVALLALTAPGFAVELGGVTLPVEVGPRSRTGAAMAFDVSAQVSDCGIGSQAQRTLELLVRRGPRTGAVEVGVDGGVVRRLDRLVARTCRRPRG